MRRFSGVEQYRQEPLPQRYSMPEDHRVRPRLAPKTTTAASGGFVLTSDQTTKNLHVQVSCSGARRARTADLLGAIQALSQLSYSPGRRTV